jgi:hypothetical protein
MTDTHSIEGLSQTAIRETFVRIQPIDLPGAKPSVRLAPAFEALKPYSITVINGEVLVDFDSGG